MRPLSTVKNDYHKLFRPMIGEDWERFSEFVRRYYHPRYILLERNFFEWQYLHNPYHRLGQFSVKVIEKLPHFLGFCGFIPYHLAAFGTVNSRAGALSNLMIAKECRALGVGLALVDDIAGGFDIIWGTGYATGGDFKSKTGPMYEKSGWRIMAVLNRYLFVLDGPAVARLTYGAEFRNVSPFPERVPMARSSEEAVVEVARFSSEVERLWEQLRWKYPIAVERQSEYLNWRYSDHPKFRYRILASRSEDGWRGYVVFRVEKAIESDRKTEYTVGRIVDLVAHDHAEIPLMSAALQKLKEAGVVLADYFSTGPFHRESLQSLGFSQCNEPPFCDIPRRLNPIDREMRKPVNFVLHVGPAVPQRERFLKSSNWYITTGEGDVDRPNNPPPPREP